MSKLLGKSDKNVEFSPIGMEEQYFLIHYRKDNKIFLEKLIFLFL